MAMSLWSVSRIAAVLALATSPAMAGGAWVPQQGAGDVQLGYSVKTARASWTQRGDTTVSRSWHIFRYGYAGGEVGLGYDTSFRYLGLYLDGLEGRRDNMERNRGLSELFLGFKHQFHEGTWPMAVALNVRTSYLYDLTGPYDRHVFLPDDDDGDGDGDEEEAVFKGESPEWRGMLGEDYGVTYLVSRSLADGGWFNLEAGYTYRTGNLGDEIPLFVEVGYPLPWRSLIAKGSYSWVQGAGNESPNREPDDRFGCSPNNCFPDASRMVVGAALFRNFGGRQRWWAEAGFNQWIWGRSARKYEEPYLSMGRRF